VAEMLPYLFLITGGDFVSREIKFRAWDKESKRMFDVQLLQFFGKENNLDACWTSGVDFDGETTLENGPNLDNLENLVLLQYTGLKDKNGVEIFEGDILFHPLQGKRKVFYPYSETVASYGLRNVDNGMGSTLQDAHRVWETIGNIYENPELLEATK